MIRTPRLPRAATDDRDPASRAGRTRSAARRTVADEERRQRRRAAVAKSAVLATGLFDADWYLRTYRDVATTDFDPLDHYCRHGRQEHRAPNAWFDDLWYRERSGIPADTDALLDYARRGEALGIPPGPQFDPAWYRTTYGLDDGVGALAHFLRNGASQPAMPPAGNSQDIRALFDANWYRATYRDIASSHQDPFDHFCRHGHSENRAPNAWFDAAWYRERAEIPPDADALVDYFRRGEALGIPPGPHFDPAWYRENYNLDHGVSPLAHFLRHRTTHKFAPCARLWSVTQLLPDQAAPDETDPFLPFLTSGQDPEEEAAAEIALVAASGLFDTNFYQVINADVFNAGIDPLTHFCAFGWKEARNPNFYFNAAWYVATNPEVERLRVNPLVHYRLVGEAAGRRPVVFFEPDWYRQRYKLPPEASPLAHYLAHRRHQTHSPNSLFDPAWYLAHCGEKLHARRDPFAHYLVAGMTRDLQPSATFDAAAWRRQALGRPTRRFRYGQSPDRDNPLVHYLLTHYR